jgi:hypothetical protein
MHIIRLGLVILVSMALSGAAGDDRVDCRVASSEAAAMLRVVASLRTVAGLLSKRRADSPSRTRAVIAGLRG